MNFCTEKKFFPVNIVKKFMEAFNNSTPNLKYAYESGGKNISFLDLNVTLSDGDLLIDLHIKPTDRHQYLHYFSSHTEHTKRSIVYNQTCE